MRVKIGNTWYDSKDQAICIQVSEEEQAHIGAMVRSVAPEGKYAKFEDKLSCIKLYPTAEAKRKWMEG